jgi:hypothetical protein
VLPGLLHIQPASFGVPLDIATCQLILLARKIRKEISCLNNALQKHTEAIHTASKREDDKRNIQPVWVTNILAKFDQSECDHEKHKEREHGIQNSIRWAAWFAVIAALIYATVAAFQWKAFEHSERAILTVTPLIDSDSRHVTFRINNLGRTPATEIRRDQSEDHGTIPPTQDISGYPPERDLELRIFLTPPDKAGFAIAAGEERQFPMELPDEREIANGGYHFVYINLGYRDVFGRDWNTYSCVWYHVSIRRFQECRPLERYGTQPK